MSPVTENYTLDLDIAFVDSRVRGAASSKHSADGRNYIPVSFYTPRKVKTTEITWSCWGVCFNLSPEAQSAIHALDPKAFVTKTKAILRVKTDSLIGTKEVLADILSRKENWQHYSGSRQEWVGKNPTEVAVMF